MQQRQLRLGDILDDYCPRERRLTNHAVVAMVGDEVKQTRCATCDAEHEFKHARLPRPRRKNEPAALAAPAMVAPKKVVQEPVDHDRVADLPDLTAIEPEPELPPVTLSPIEDRHDDEDDEMPREEGPVHRQLIRAQLPRIEGQPKETRPGPDFTIRQPAAGRPNRFRPRQPHSGPGHAGGNTMFGNRAGGNVSRDPRGGQRGPGGHAPMNARGGKRHQGGQGGHGRKRSK